MNKQSPIKLHKEQQKVEECLSFPKLWNCAFLARGPPDVLHLAELDSFGPYLGEESMGKALNSRVAHSW